MKLAVDGNKYEVEDLTQPCRPVTGIRMPATSGRAAESTVMGYSRQSMTMSSTRCCSRRLYLQRKNQFGKGADMGRWQCDTGGIETCAAGAYSNAFGFQR
jgi:hypothetical protein